MNTRSWVLPDVEATESLARSFACVLSFGGLVTLRGDLGAGKTTFVRALLRALGHEGPVRSPTYAIVEPYRIGSLDVYHLDLYRIADAGELEFLGLREWLRPENLILIEWPERAGDALPTSDLDIRLVHDDDARRAFLSGARAIVHSDS